MSVGLSLSLFLAYSRVVSHLLFLEVFELLQDSHAVEEKFVSEEVVMEEEVVAVYVGEQASEEEVVLADEYHIFELLQAEQ